MRSRRRRRWDDPLTRRTRHPGHGQRDTTGHSTRRHTCARVCYGLSAGETPLVDQKKKKKTVARVVYETCTRSDQGRWERPGDRSNLNFTGCPNSFSSTIAISNEIIRQYYCFQSFFVFPPPRSTRRFSRQSVVHVSVCPAGNDSSDPSAVPVSHPPRLSYRRVSPGTFRQNKIFFRF